jgi:protein O-mannosyl-transferase
MTAPTTPPRKWLPLLAVGLAVLTLLTYLPVRECQFAALDDRTYVEQNPHVNQGLSWPAVVWAFTSSHAFNWHPLTWLSHALDCQLYGLSPAGHHLTNLLLHTINVVLLLLVLSRMTGAVWRSALVAALFGLHPLRVESVAWVAERKDVLSGFFFLLTLLAYTAYVRAGAGRQRAGSLEPGAKNESKSAAGREPTSDLGLRTSDLGKARSGLYYALALLAYAGGLMSKPMLVTTPFVLLLLDYWPLGRLDLADPATRRAAIWRRVWEKLPFFALSLCSSLITLMAQRNAMAETTAVPLLSRFANAALSAATYLVQTLWPTRLAVLYPYPQPVPVLESLLALFALTVMTLAVVRALHDQPWAWVGWFWYLGMLVPVIGLIQVGRQSRADRYTYLPCIGLLILGVWTLGALVAAQPRLKNRSVLGAVLAMLALALLTRHQVAYWRTSRSLFEHTVAVTGPNSEAEAVLANLCLLNGELAAAKGHIERALAIDPAEPLALYNAGVALQLEGHWAEAVPCLQRHAADESPALTAARNFRLGRSLTELGKFDEARAAFETALKTGPDDRSRLDIETGISALLSRQGKTNEAEQAYAALVARFPADAAAQVAFAGFLLEHNRLPEAEARFQAALQIDPLHGLARRSLAMTLARQGRPEAALEQLRQAIARQPNPQLDPVAYAELAQIFNAQGHSRAAMVCHEALLAQDPRAPGPLNNLAWLLATTQDPQVRDGARAVQLAQQACELTGHQQPVCVGTLAAALAEAGRFAEAQATARQAAELARQHNDEPLAARNDELRKLYDQNQPYHEPVPTAATTHPQ